MKILKIIYAKQIRSEWFMEQNFDFIFLVLLTRSVSNNNFQLTPNYANLLICESFFVTEYNQIVKV